MLNRSNVRYLPITAVAYATPGGEQRSSDCVLVNIDDVVMLDADPTDEPPTR